MATSILLLRGVSDIGQINTALDELEQRLRRIGSARLNLNINPDAFQRLNRRLIGVGRSTRALTSQFQALCHVTDALQPKFERLSNAVTSFGQSGVRARTVSGQLARASQQVTSATTGQARGWEVLGEQTAITTQRYLGFVIASRLIFGSISAVNQALRESIAFNTELTRTAQLLADVNQGSQAFVNLRNNINATAIEFGIDQRELAEVATTLAQTGASLRDIQQIVNEVGRSTRLPTFADAQQTVDGLIAALAQFGLEANQASVIIDRFFGIASESAVEVADLFQAVRRAGAVFAALSSDTQPAIDSLTELAAITSVVRQTTRQSGDRIATALRTIFTRVQRPQVLEFLRQFNIELIRNGRFIGGANAIVEIGQALRNIPENSPQFIRIAQEISGLRQIDSVIPLLRNFANIQDEVNKALAGGDAAAQALEEANVDLGVQIAQLTAAFRALFIELSNSVVFQSVARALVIIAEAAVQAARAVDELIAAFAAFALLRVGAGLPAFLRGIRGRGSSLLGLNQGGRVGMQGGGRVQALLTPGELFIPPGLVRRIGIGNLERINRGRSRGFRSSELGIVPGTGNTDSVPATLPEGSFIIRKSAAGDFLKFLGGAGFNSGGLVGFNRGGRVRAQTGGQISDTLQELFNGLETIVFRIDRFARGFNRGPTLAPGNAFFTPGPDVRNATISNILGQPPSVARTFVSNETARALGGLSTASDASIRSLEQFSNTLRGRFTFLARGAGQAVTAGRLATVGGIATLAGRRFLEDENPLAIGIDAIGAGVGTAILTNLLRRIPRVGALFANSALAPVAGIAAAIGSAGSAVTRNRVADLDRRERQAIFSQEVGQIADVLRERGTAQIAGADTIQAIVDRQSRSPLLRAVGLQPSTQSVRDANQARRDTFAQDGSFLRFFGREAGFQLASFFERSGSEASLNRSAEINRQITEVGAARSDRLLEISQRERTNAATSLRELLSNAARARADVSDPQVIERIVNNAVRGRAVTRNQLQALGLQRARRNFGANVDLTGISPEALRRGGIAELQNLGSQLTALFTRTAADVESVRTLTQNLGLLDEVFSSVDTSVENIRENINQFGNQIEVLRNNISGFQVAPSVLTQQQAAGATFGVGGFALSENDIREFRTNLRQTIGAAIARTPGDPGVALGEFTERSLRGNRALGTVFRRFPDEIQREIIDVVRRGLSGEDIGRDISQIGNQFIEANRALTNLINQNNQQLAQAFNQRNQLELQNVQNLQQTSAVLANAARFNNRFFTRDPVRRAANERGIIDRDLVRRLNIINPNVIRGQNILDDFGINQGRQQFLLQQRQNLQAQQQADPLNQALIRQLAENSLQLQRNAAATSALRDAAQQQIRAIEQNLEALRQRRDADRGTLLGLLGQDAETLNRNRRLGAILEQGDRRFINNQTLAQAAEGFRINQQLRGVAPEVIEQRLFELLRGQIANVFPDAQGLANRAAQDVDELPGARGLIEDRNQIINALNQSIQQQAQNTQQQIEGINIAINQQAVAFNTQLQTAIQQSENIADINEFINQLAGLTDIPDQVNVTHNIQFNDNFLDEIRGLEPFIRQLVINALNLQQDDIDEDPAGVNGP